MMKKAKPFRFRVRSGSRFNFMPSPSQPQFATDEDRETLTGEVDGMTASAPEERLAQALDKAGFQYMFRYIVGAPKGLPGWKELDFVVFAGGIVHPVEVDTAFTHRGKAAQDQLHDTIILNDYQLNLIGTLAPLVRHADGDSELSSMKESEAYVKRTFGRP